MTRYSGPSAGFTKAFVDAAGRRRLRLDPLFTPFESASSLAALLACVQSEIEALQLFANICLPRIEPFLSLSLFGVVLWSMQRTP